MANLDDYRKWLLAQGLSTSTVNQRVQFARARWRDWQTWQVPADEIALFLSQWSGWTRRTYQSHLTSLFGWLVEVGQVEVSPCARIRRAPMPHRRPMPLSPAELDLVLSHASGDMLTWLQLARLAGLRGHEIAKLRGEDVDSVRLFVLGKGGRAEVVPTHPEVWRMAQAYPRVGYWFPRPTSVGHVSGKTISNRTHNHFQQLGIAKSIHRLRANYGTELLRAGANIKVVQSLMRHNSLASTEHYLAIDEDERVEAIGLLRASSADSRTEAA